MQKICKKKNTGTWDIITIQEFLRKYQLYQNFRGAQITPTYPTSGTGTSV